MVEFELKILDYIKDVFGSAFLDKIVPIITSLGYNGIIWIALAVILLFFRKTRPLALSIAISLSLGFIFGNLIIKNLVARIRPYEYRNEITLLVAKLKDYSFPSGHTLAAFEAATCVFIRYKKLGILALAFAAVIAFTRLYLYVHFLSDVLAGAILGVIIAIIASAIVNRIYKKSNIIKNKNLID